MNVNAGTLNITAKGDIKLTALAGNIEVASPSGSTEDLGALINLLPDIGLYHDIGLVPGDVVCYGSSLSTATPAIISGKVSL